MARLFQVTLPEGMSNVKLDSQGRATVQCTAKNVSGTSLDGRAVLISLPPITPPSGVVQKGWVKIDGSPERHFEKDKEEVFTIRIMVPPKSAAGDYMFRLDMTSVARPDEGDSGSTIKFSVAGPAPNGGSKWPLIILLVILALGVGGVVTWLLLRKPDKTVAEEPAPPTQPAPQPQPTPAPQPTPQPAPTPSGPPSGQVQIMNEHSNLCLSPAGGGRDKNVQIVQYLCDQDPSRLWTFRVVSGDVVQIANVNSDMCLTVAGGNTERNDPSVQYFCDQDPSRRWHYTPVDEKRFRLVNVNSGLCLTIAGGGSDKNTVAVQYPCDGDPSRDWEIRAH